MALTPLQVASAQIALKALEQDPEFAHPVATIIRIAGEEVAEAIRAREAEYREYNGDVSGDTAMLSAEAAGYWADWQKMYREGKRFHAKGSGMIYPKWEKKISLMCEALDESFEARVPDNEKAKFQVYDPQRMDAGNWDDRWDACVDLFPPVLRREFLGDARVSNPKGKAQHEILSGMIAPIPAPVLPTQQSKKVDLRELARRLRE